MQTPMNTIGAMVYWNKLSAVRVDRALFRMGIIQAGLGDALAAEPKPEKLLHDAATHGTRRGNGCIVVDLKSKDAEATYAVIANRPHVDALGAVTDRVKWIEEATISIDRLTANPTPTIRVHSDAPLDDNRTNVIADVLETYEELRQFVNTNEVSTTLVRAMDMLHGFTLRTGAYFIPASELARVYALQAFLAESTDCALSVWDITPTARNVGEAREGAREALSDKVDRLVGKVEAFVASIAGEETVPARSIVARARAFRDLDAEVSVLADVLGAYAQELAATIAEAKQRLLGDFLGDIDADLLDADQPTDEDATIAA